MKSHKPPKRLRDFPVGSKVLLAGVERDKATQYWQIAEGRCDALQANLEVAKHNCEAQERENERLQALCDRLAHSLQCLFETFGSDGSSCKALAAWREMKGQP